MTPNPAAPEVPPSDASPPTSDPNPPPHDATAAPPDPSTDPELYAASAAETALPLAKSTSPPSDLSLSPDAPPAPPLSKEELVEEALNCPCIAAMRDGPCGDSFVAAYRCFLESETEPKGMDCMQQFTGMQGCMAEHPDEYNVDGEGEDPFAGGETKGERGTRGGEETVKEKVGEKVSAVVGEVEEKVSAVVGEVEEKVSTVVDEAERKMRGGDLQKGVGEGEERKGSVQNDAARMEDVAA